jgi:outer membrane biosynthesis protein TonB
MSNDAMRAFAVGEAIKLHAGVATDAKTVIKTAKELMTYISPDAPPAQEAATPGKEPAKPTPPAPKPAAKAAPKKAAPKPAPEPEPETEETAEGDDAIDYESDAGKEEVGKLVAQLIAANRRPEAVKLLGEYDSTSVSGVKAGEREAFCAEARELIAAGPDIES